jgi:two-component system, OmpR family, sensor kinase
MRRALAPIAAALLGLAGSLAATFALHRAASAAIDRVLDERLRGAGETAARLVDARDPAPARLRDVMDVNRLEGAYVLSPDLVVLADASGARGEPADLLRVDPARVARALAGEASVGPGYAVGAVAIQTGYFPLRDAGGRIPAVLALEAGQAFAAERARIERALVVAVVLSAAGAIALALTAARWTRSERLRRDAAARAARGEAVTRMAASVAHEIRNPLGIIRAAVDLVSARAGEALSQRDRERLQDVLGEVERLRRLTQDFLDLSAEPKLARQPVDLAALADEAVRGTAALHPELEVRVALEPVPVVRADPGRIRQVLANLLANAARAGARHVRIDGATEPGAVRLTVRDDGRGIDPGMRERLFEPFATASEGGTGLGLAVSRRIVERHGGTLSAVDAPGPGAVFALRLPVAPEEKAWPGS